MKVLLVEDSEEKRDKVQEFLIGLNLGMEILVAGNVISACKLAKTTEFSLVILDVVIPFADYDDPCPTNCKKLLQLIQGQLLRKPPFFVLLTERIDRFEEVRNELVRFGWTTIEYSTDERWRLPLENISKTLIHNINTSGEFDVVWIVALRDSEFLAVRGLPLKWEEFVVEGDANCYYKTRVVHSEGHEFSIVLGCAQCMGPVGAAEIASRMIKTFRPRLVVMSGISGGVKGKCGLGDIIIAKSVFDYGSGKLKESNEGVYLDPSPNDIPCDFLLSDLINRFIESRLWHKSILEGMPDVPKIDRTKAHFEPLASGANVIGSPKVVGEIVGRNRKVVGIEMESYAVFHCCRATIHPSIPVFVCKAVSDFADLHKDDKFRMRCSRASAIATFEFCKSWHVELNMLR